MARRKNLFLKALDENNPTILPRLAEEQRPMKCRWCEFYNKCMNEDSENDVAREMAREKDLLDIEALVRVS